MTFTAWTGRVKAALAAPREDQCSTLRVLRSGVEVARQVAKPCIVHRCPEYAVPGQSRCEHHWRAPRPDTDRLLGELVRRGLTPVALAPAARLCAENAQRILDAAARGLLREQMDV